MLTLGINAAFHDCAAALVRDGELLAAAEEERFTHVKHGKRPLPFSTWQLPFHAIDYCLREAGLHLADVDRIAYSLDPALLAARMPATIELPLEPSRRQPAQPGTSPWEPLFLSYVVNAPRQLASGAPHHLQARLRDDGPFQRVWVQPAVGDAGTALGAALWIDWSQRAGERRRWHMQHACWGPAYADDDIESLLRWSKLPYRKVEDIVGETAKLLAQDRVVGWFQGRMEFGPRALGARSILASPISPRMQQRLNDIKDREDFRPVAPVVLEEKAPDWFVRRRPQPGADSGFPAPYMLFVFDVRPEVAERIPVVRHRDGTARVQTIRRQDHPRYYDLLRAFERLTGVPVLVNTSFNTRGEPIVCTPRDAVESFWTSPLDALAIGWFLLEKPR